MTLYQMLYTFWWIMSSVFKVAGLWAPLIIVIVVAIRNIQNGSEDEVDNDE